jgi:hypothetical protein
MLPAGPGNGRFDFWGMLLHTHAVTPPAVRSVWRRVTRQLLPGWLVLPALMAVGVGAAVFVGHQRVRPSVVGEPKAISVAAPARPSSPW